MSGGPLDVSLRVRMRYDAGGARQAIGDLGRVEEQARKLGAIGSSRLGNDLRGVAGAAQGADRAIAGAAAQAVKLGAAGSGRLGGELRGVVGAAQGVDRALAGAAAQAVKLGAAGTGQLEAGLKRLDAPAATAGRRLEETGRAAARLGNTTVAPLAAGLREVYTAGTVAAREVAATAQAAVKLVGAVPEAREIARELRGVARAAEAASRELKEMDAAAERIGRHRGLGSQLAPSAWTARHHGTVGSGFGRHSARLDFGSEAMMAAGIGGGLRYGMGAAAAGGLAAGGGIALTAAATVKATREAISFESAMAEVRKAVNDLSPEGVAALERKLLQVSAATGIAKEQMAQLTAQAGFAGRPTEDLARFAEFGAKAGVAFGMTAEATGDALAKLGNVFKLRQADIEDLAGGINMLGDNTAAKERQLIGFLYRSGETGAKLGLTPFQTGALGAGAIAAGREEEVASTAFNALSNRLGNLKNQSKDFQQGLRTIGTNSRQLKKDFDQNPFETYLKVLEKINALPKDHQIEVAHQFVGQEHGPELLTYAGQVGAIREAYAKLQDQAARAGSVEKAFKIFDNTTQRNIARTTASIEGFAARIGKHFTPIVNEAAGAVERWFKGMNKAMDRRAEAEELAKRMVGGETLPPKDKARIEADPRLKDEVGRAEFYQRRRQELETNRERARNDPGSLPSQDEFRRKFEGRAKEWEERRQRALNPPAPPPDAPAVPGTGKRSDLSSEARVSLAGYYQEVDGWLDRTERRADEAGRHMREDLAIGAKFGLVPLSVDPDRQARFVNASLGGGLLGRGGGAGRGGGYGGAAGADADAGTGAPRFAPGRFGGLIPPRAGERFGGSAGGGQGGERADRDGPAGDGGAHRRFGDGGGTRGAARTGQMMAYATDQLRREGVPEAHLRQAAAHLVGQAQMESGLDPNKSHDGGTGYGIYGARDPSPGRGRRTDMLNWLEKNGYAKNSAEGQMRYMAHEAMSGRYRQTRRVLMGEGSGDLEQDTNTITREFESPKVVNRRSGAVRNAMRIGPEGAAAGRGETEGAAGRGVRGAEGSLPPRDGAGGVDQRQSGTRRQPITSELRDQLAYAGAQSGVNAEVYSGGQDAHGPNRTGSHRHDHGRSADVRLYRPDADGRRRYLSMNDPADRSVMEGFIRNSVKAGATGVGAGPGYMGDKGIHIGGGSPLAWGRAGGPPTRRTGSGGRTGTG